MLKTNLRIKNGEKNVSGIAMFAYLVVLFLTLRTSGSLKEQVIVLTGEEP